MWASLPDHNLNVLLMVLLMWRVPLPRTMWLGSLLFFVYRTVKWMLP
jgi:hypothetical protein